MLVYGLYFLLNNYISLPLIVFLSLRYYDLRWVKFIILTIFVVHLLFRFLPLYSF